MAEADAHQRSAHSTVIVVTKELAPEIYAAFREFGQRVFADGALPSKTKQLIAVAVAHVTQRPYCIRQAKRMKRCSRKDSCSGTQCATAFLAESSHRLTTVAAVDHSMNGIDNLPAPTAVAD